MTDNTNIAPERGEQSEAPNPAPAGRIVNRRLAAQIRLAIETGGGVDDILPLVQQLRNDANPTACSDLDINKYCGRICTFEERFRSIYKYRERISFGVCNIIKDI